MHQVDFRATSFANSIAARIPSIECGEKSIGARIFFTF
jgi:hypothetical protein